MRRECFLSPLPFLLALCSSFPSSLFILHRLLFHLHPIPCRVSQAIQSYVCRDDAAVVLLPLLFLSFDFPCSSLVMPTTTTTTPWSVASGLSADSLRGEPRACCSLSSRVRLCERVGQRILVDDSADVRTHPRLFRLCRVAVRRSVILCLACAVCGGIAVGLNDTQRCWLVGLLEIATVQPEA